MPTRLICMLLLAAAASGTEIAVWDPGSDAAADRLVLHRAPWDAVAAWLQRAGHAVVRVDAARMRGAGGPIRAPVLVMSAQHVPLAAGRPARDDGQRAYIDYLDAGGVIVGLATSPGGAWFGCAISEDADLGWQLSPPTPRFAWEISGIGEALGLRYAYDIARQDLGVRHVPSRLLRRHWPEAPVVTARLRQVQHMSAGATVLPIYDSRDAGGAAAAPAVMLVRNGRRRAILVAQPEWWSAPAPSWFAGAERLVPALVGIALAEHDGGLGADADAVRDPQPDGEAGGPLRQRLAIGAGEPAGALALARWGRFDGSCRDLATGPLPQRLDPGASVELPMPARPRAAWLRMRCAYDADGAGLEARDDGGLLHSELFIALAPGGGPPQPRSDAPAEITRCVFLPPGPAGRLRLANPGQAPLWFDAVQVEERPAGGAPLRIGLSCLGRPPVELPAALRAAASLTAHVRLDRLGPPGDPQRFAVLDADFAAVARLGLPLELRLVGTPAWLAEEGSLAEARRRGGAAAARPRSAEALLAWAAHLRIPAIGIAVGDEAETPRAWLAGWDAYAGLLAEALPGLRRALPGIPISAAPPALPAPEMLEALDAAGALHRLDGWPAHAHAASGAWDAVAGRHEGDLLALGLATPAPLAGQGFPGRGGEEQARLLGLALARALAAGHAGIVVADLGSDRDDGILAPDGSAGASCRVLADYLELNGAGAVRCDPALTASDGQPLRGIYAVASVRGDGVVTAVLDPCQSRLPVAVRLRLPLPDARPRTATVAQGGGSAAEQALRSHAAGGTAWVEMELLLHGRALVRMVPR